MEESARDPRGNGDQFFLSLEYLHLSSARKFREIHRAAGPDAGSIGIVASDTGEFRQQFARVNEAGFRHVALAQLIEREGILDGELGDFGAAKSIQVGAAACQTAHFVCDGPHVGPRSDLRTEIGPVAFDRDDVQRFDLDLYRLQGDFFVFPRQLVGRDTMDLLGGERWRKLLDGAAKMRSKRFKFVARHAYLLYLSGRLAFTIVGIGGKSKAHRALIHFFGTGIELGEAGETSDHERKNARGYGVERTEVSDRALLKNAAHAVDDVVRGQPCGFIDYDDAIHEMIW